MRKLAFLLLEIIIGLSLFGLLLFLGIDKFRERIYNHPSYTVSFNDVDGLSIGSPVRLMGKQVGNIIKLELNHSKIFVTFRIVEANIIIPDDSIASIQFTGLAGSRSLEIIPPKRKHLTNNKRIYSQEPIRINSIMHVQTDIFENVVQVCRQLLSFLSKSSIDSTKQNVQTTSKYMQDSNQSMNGVIKNIKQSGSDISKNTKEIKQFLNDQNENIHSAYQSFDKLAKDPNSKNNMADIQKSVEKLSSSIETSKASKKVSEMTNDLNNMNTKIKNFNQKISKVKNREVNYVSEVNTSLQKTTAKLQGFIDFARANFKKTTEKSDKKE